MMKRTTTAILALLFAMVTPMMAAAMSQDDMSSQGKVMSDDMKHGAMDHAKEMSGDMHKGHDMSNMEEGFVEVGKDTQDGVVATVKVKTYDEKAKATMAKMGMNATHHVMVFFTDEKTGESVGSGMVAIKVENQDDKPVMMMQMGPGFGGDVSIKEKGMYTFEIGTKLADGKKRQFEVEYHNM